MTTRTTNSSGPLPGLAARAVPYLPLGILAGLGAVLAYLWKWPCRFGGAWNVLPGQYTNFCYTDIYPLFWAEHLNEGMIPYVDYPVEYPVGIGAIMEFVRRLSGGSGETFYDITVLLMGVSLVVGVLLMAALAGPTRRWDALWYALSPAVILAAYINWDLAAGAFALGGLLAWARHRHYLAGVLLALAVATKFYPLMFFGALFLLTLRTAKWLPFLKTAAAAAGTWLLVNVPVMLINYEGWKRFYSFSSERGADWGGLWFFFQKKQWPILGDGESLNTMAMAVLALLLLGVAVLALAAPRRPRLAQLCFLALAAFMITNKVWSPQFVLWLVPFAVLARPKWGALVAWQIAESWYFFSIWLYLTTQMPEFAHLGIGDTPYFLSMWARAITIVVLMALVVRDILRPERDAVRQSRVDGQRVDDQGLDGQSADGEGADGQGVDGEGVDDQSGGVFDRAPDRFTLRTLTTLSTLSPGARASEAATSEAATSEAATSEAATSEAATSEAATSDPPATA